MTIQTAHPKGGVDDDLRWRVFEWHAEDYLAEVLGMSLSAKKATIDELK